jgi:hypothetical protein
LEFTWDGRTVAGEVDAGRASCILTRGCARTNLHERMARGGHGLPKVSPRPAMPDPLRPAGGPPLRLKRPYGLRPSSTPACQARPVYALPGGPPLKRPYSHFKGGPPGRAGGLCPSPTPLDTPRHTPLQTCQVFLRSRSTTALLLVASARVQGETTSGFQRSGIPCKIRLRFRHAILFLVNLMIRGDNVKN